MPIYRLMRMVATDPYRYMEGLATEFFDSDNEQEQSVLLENITRQAQIMMEKGKWSSMLVYQMRLPERREDPAEWRLIHRVDAPLRKLKEINKSAKLPLEKKNPWHHPSVNQLLAGAPTYTMYPGQVSAILNELAALPEETSSHD